MWCDRLVFLKNAAIGIRYGLAINAIATIAVNGSGWSAECERILPAIGAVERTTDTALGKIVEVLEGLAQPAFSCGAPTIILNDIRATYEVQAKISGREASLDATASRHESMAASRFSAQ